MKPAFIKSLLFSLSSCLVVACTPYSIQNMQNEDMDPGKRQVLGIGVGVVGEPLVGGSMGQSMDHSDYIHAYYAMDHARKNKAHHWKNKNGMRYTLIPTSAAKKMYGHKRCRNYTMIASLHGKKEKVYGVACRKSDSTWENIR